MYSKSEVPDSLSLTLEVSGDTTTDPLATLYLCPSLAPISDDFGNTLNGVRSPIDFSTDTNWVLQVPHTTRRKCIVINGYFQQNWNSWIPFTWIPEELNKLNYLLVVVTAIHSLWICMVVAMSSAFQEKAWVQGYIRHSNNKWVFYVIIMLISLPFCVMKVKIMCQYIIGKHQFHFKLRVTKFNLTPTSYFTSILWVSNVFFFFQAEVLTYKSTLKFYFEFINIT